MPAVIRGAFILHLAVIGSSCGSKEAQRVLTVKEVEPRIDELDGETVSVAGYISRCGGYDCVLYDTKADADALARLDAADPKGRLPRPEVPAISIGSGTRVDFDPKAAPFTNSYVVITGTITNECRFEGKPACTDRGPDLDPTTIRAGRPPTGR